MKRTWIVFLSLILFVFFSQLSFANSVTVKQLKYILAPVKFKFEKQTLTITNTSSQDLNLHNAKLNFMYAGNINSIIDNKNNKLKFVMHDALTQSHNAGNDFEINFVDTQILPANKTLSLQFIGVQNEKPHGFQLQLLERMPVNVTVTTANQNWVETISICNTSGSVIPLKDLQFQFNYDVNMPTNIWGQPWVAWKVTSQQGTLVTLTGGSPWSSDLASDPNCTSPLTIQFDAAPALAQPRAPFTFEAAGGEPSNFGAINVILPSAPVIGLDNPTINIAGATNRSQIVTWGTQWRASDLTPGSYIVSASPVNNENIFYEAKPINISVTAQTTTQANITYQTVPNAQLTITLVNAPDIQEPVTFTGKNYMVTKIVANNTVITLPKDTYTVSSMIGGYTSIITPDPITIPGTASITVTYQVGK